MKIISCLLTIAIIFATFTITAFAKSDYALIFEQDANYNASETLVGDMNDDGKINMADVPTVRKYLAKWDIDLKYEYADLNGDRKINMADVLVIRKYLAKWDVEFAEVLSASVGDVTDELIDMGKIYEGFWSDDEGYEYTIARNPFDMVTYNGKIFVSAGNYNVNLGPVNIRYITRENEKAKSSSALSTEQTDRFYKFDDSLFCLATDPQAWLTGEFYQLNPEKNKWITRNQLLQNIHLYDMAKHNGQYFFCGSNVSYDNPDGAEFSKGSVFRFDGESLQTSTKSQYIDVPFVYKDGTVIDYSGKNGVPRVFEFCEYNGELYAFYYDAVLDKNKELYPQYFGDYKTVDGLYKYNDEKKQFEYIESNFKYAYLSGGYTKDHESVMRDFQWQDDYVIVNNYLFLTNDFKNYEKIAVNNNENYFVRDCLVIGDKMYYLVNEKGENGHYRNAVYETQDFENWREILNFDTYGFVRSFEFCDGMFAFAIGTSVDDAKSNAMGSKECGRVFKYLYYN